MKKWFKKKTEDTEEFKAGFEAGVTEGFARCRKMIEDGNKWRTCQFEEWAKQLKEEKDKWEEQKARYVLEQLKQIKGG